MTLRDLLSMADKCPAAVMDAPIVVGKCTVDSDLLAVLHTPIVTACVSNDLSEVILYGEADITIHDDYYKSNKEPK